eukprot:PhM_4_TR17374/c1_g1_i4/m.73160
MINTSGIMPPSDQQPLLAQHAAPPPPQDTGRFGNAYMRFSIVFALLVVGIGTMPLWLGIAVPHVAAYIMAGGMMWFSVVWLVVSINAARNYCRLGLVPLPPWGETLSLRSRRCFKHICVVPCYLDPLDVLHNCIDTLVFQSKTEDLVVVVTFEKKTPDLQTKIDSVKAAYSDKFGDFLVVVHALQPRIEIPGGCSNKNFALREAYKYCSERYGGPIVHQPAEAPTKTHSEAIDRRYTITTCDTDSKFHPRYFEVLEQCYNSENPSCDGPVKMNVWQPPLFYNWNLDERPFFNRVTCLMRMMMMLGGLISFNVNPMSIFSYPVELGYAAGFINPRYGVDDIIAKVRWMCATDSKVPVKLLPVIVISGPTVGTSFNEEVHDIEKNTFVFDAVARLFY